MNPRKPRINNQGEPFTARTMPVANTAAIANHVRYTRNNFMSRDGSRSDIRCKPIPWSLMLVPDQAGPVESAREFGTQASGGTNESDRHAESDSELDKPVPAIPVGRASRKMPRSAHPVSWMTNAPSDAPQI